jgi:hypothetical protein
MDPSLRKKFAINREFRRADLSRFKDKVCELDIEQLCSVEDLQSPSRGTMQT